MPNVMYVYNRSRISDCPKRETQITLLTKGKIMEWNLCCFCLERQKPSDCPAWTLLHNKQPDRAWDSSSAV